MDWTELFCHVDDFCQQFEPTWHRQQLESGQRKRRRSSRLTSSEIMTILIMFHASNYRTFKHFYRRVQREHAADFPRLVSYSRFVELMPSVLAPLCAYLQSRFGASTGIAFVDSTALAVCKNKRINRHRVFEGTAQRGKTTMGWFFGFKLHLVVNDRGELLSFDLTPGNVDDRQPVESITKNLWGKLFGDKVFEARAWYQKSRSYGRGGACERDDGTERDCDSENAFGIELAYPNDRVRWQFVLQEIQEDYRPALGFVRRDNARR